MTHVKPMPMVYDGPHDKVSYTIRNLTTGKDYLADVTHLRPCFYDPKFTTPLNVAARDTKEYVVKIILRHDFSNPAQTTGLIYTTVSDLPDDGTTKWSSRKRGNILLSGPSTHNTADQATMRKHRRGRSTKQITSITTGIAPEDA